MKIDLLSTENGIHLYHTGDDIGIVNFKSKANCGSIAVLQGLQQAIDLAEKKLKGLIIYQESDKFFCVGADLLYACRLADQQDTKGIHDYISFFQQTALRCRYSSVPVIAAVRGYALGGGCEIAMHCFKTVAMSDSRIGLVESAIGLLPSAGGSKEMILRASHTPNYFATLTKYFLNLTEGKISKNAETAKEMGFLRSDDIIVTQVDELLSQAKKILLNSTYTSPTPPLISTLGEDFEKLLLQKYSATTPIASEHDHFIAQHIAHVLSGSKCADSVTEKTILNLEVAAFEDLIVRPLTLERIRYTLETSKHLRN